MASDLVGDSVQVHDMAKAVLDYWFGLTTEQQFGKDADRDRVIAEKFGSAREAVLAGKAAGWRDDPERLLAAIILLDQFSRNIHRGTPQAFAADDLAVALTLEAIGKGWEGRYPPEQRVFLYMPLMHAEDRPLQDLSVAKFGELGIESNLAFARDHRDVLYRFGRFPGRNIAVARETTAEEAEWLGETDGGW